MTYTNATTGCDHEADWRLARPGLPVAGNNPWICTGCEQPVHVDDNGRSVLGSPGANATTLVEFLRARLDASQLRGETLETMAEALRSRDSGLADYINDAARLILADVEAKRRIVAIHADYDAVEDIYMGHECIDDTNGLIRWYQADCPTLRLLALPFAAHPDYDPSWRPAEVTA